MKKLLILSSLIFSINYVVYANSDDYLSHCNISFGVSLKAEGNITGSHGLDITLMDGYGDYYGFSYSSDEDDSSLAGFNLTFIVYLFITILFCLLDFLAKQ